MKGSLLAEPPLLALFRVDEDPPRSLAREAREGAVPAQDSGTKGVARALGGLVRSGGLSLTAREIRRPAAAGPGTISRGCGTAGSRGSP